MSDTVLNAKKLCVILGGNTIVENVDFRVRKGELVGILGPSGSGKSTLLRALSGFRPARKGKVIFQGRDLYEDFDELKRSIGFVPQDDVVPRALKVERALGYTAELRLQEFSKEEKKGRVDGVIQTLGLAKSRKQRISKLSGGQRKRVSVAMELIARPKLLFADEPTSGLDPALERSLTATMRKLADGGRAVVVTTHIMSSLDILDALCVLNDGKLCYFGPVDGMKEFFEVEDFVDIYANLQKRPVSEWRRKYDRSGLRREYLRG